MCSDVKMLLCVVFPSCCLSGWVSTERVTSRIEEYEQKSYITVSVVKFQLVV